MNNPEGSIEWNIDQFAETYKTDVTKFINSCVALKRMTEFLGGEWPQDNEDYIQDKIKIILDSEKKGNYKHKECEEVEGECGLCGHLFADGCELEN